MAMKLACFTILLTCCFTVAVFAQNAESQTAAQVTSTDLSSVTDVRQLFAERETLIKELRELDQVIAEQSNKVRNLPSAEALDQDLQKFKRELENAQKTASDPQRIETLKRTVDSTAANLDIAKNAEPILKENTAERNQKQQRLFAIEQRIASLFDATRDENQFRSAATYAFTGLVLVVVGGFFFIAYRKDGIAAKIFGGEMGMQFVTLFLIVIAIILFGIMGTLEGKELAALLGGLSGYILGKTGFKREEPASAPNAVPNLEPGG